MAAVNSRFERDKAALISAERGRWEAEQAEKIRQATLTAEQKAASDAAAADQRAKQAEARAAQLERMEKLRDAADKVGFVPATYLRDALNSVAADAVFDPEAIAAAAHATAKADAARIVGVTPGVHVGAGTVAVAATPKTGGATNNGQTDWGQWTSQQAADHISLLTSQKKFKEAKEFLNDFKRAKQAP
jgi:hypothetical protein